VFAVGSLLKVRFGTVRQDLDLVTAVHQLDRRIAMAATDIQTAVNVAGATLTQLCSISALTAGKILGRVRA
jgi:transposase